MDKKEQKDYGEVPSLQLKIYENIPIPDLPVNTSDTAKSVDSLFLLSLFIFASRGTLSFYCRDLLEFVGCISSQEAIFSYHRHGENTFNTSTFCDVDALSVLGKSTFYPS